jgi:microcystin-dependent protein
MLGMLNRDRMKGVLGPVLDEFEYLYARLNGILRENFDDNGVLLQAPVDQQVPTGTVLMWSTNTAPTGFVLCQGQQVNRLAYKALFDVIGTTYGAGDGSLTFNVPNLKQRFPLGKADSGTGATLGSTGGNIDHTHSGGSLSGSTGATAPSGSTNSAGSHDHGAETGFVGGSLDFAVGSGSPTLATFGHSHTIGSDGSHSHTVTVDSHTHGAGTLALSATGSANPPFLALNFIIKT